MRNTLFSILVFLICSAAVADFEVRCRKVIHGSFKVDAFDGWTIVTNDMESTLDGVSIATTAKGLFNSKPNNFSDTGIRSGTLKIGEGENWIVCHHSKMKMVIEKKIPSDLKTCAVKENTDAIDVKCSK